MQFESFNELECFKRCKNDNNCHASTYYANYKYSCFLYNSDYEEGYESEWISYFKNGKNLKSKIK